MRRRWEGVQKTICGRQIWFVPVQYRPLLLPPPDDLQLEKKLSPEIFFWEWCPLEVKLRLGAVVVE